MLSLFACILSDEKARKMFYKKVAICSDEGESLFKMMQSSFCTVQVCCGVVSFGKIYVHYVQLGGLRLCVSLFLHTRYALCTPRWKNVKLHHRNLNQEPSAYRADVLTTAPLSSSHPQRGKQDITPTCLLTYWLLTLLKWALGHKLS